MTSAEEKEMQKKTIKNDARTAALQLTIGYVEKEEFNNFTGADRNYNDYKSAVNNVLELAKSLRSQGTGSIVHLQVKGYEQINTSAETLQPTAAPPTAWLFIEETLPRPRPEGSVADDPRTSIKPSQCASLLPQEAPRNASTIH